MKIEKPGHYRTRDNRKVEVVDMRKGYAIGFCDNVPTAWICDGGQHWNRCSGSDGSDQRLAIVAEWREPVQQAVTLALVERQSGIDVVWSRNIGHSKVLARRTITITEGEGLEPARS